MIFIPFYVGITRCHSVSSRLRTLFTTCSPFDRGSLDVNSELPRHTITGPQFRPLLSCLVIENLARCRPVGLLLLNNPHILRGYCTFSFSKQELTIPRFAEPRRHSCCSEITI